MRTRMDVVIWTVAFLSSALNLKGEFSPAPGSPRTDVIATHPRVTPHNTAAEAETTRALVNVFYPPQADTSPTEATGPSPPPEPVTTHGTIQTHATPSHSKKCQLPGRLTSPNAVQGSSRLSEEHLTSSTQATITTSEAVSLVPSSSPSGPASTLMALTEDPQTTGPAPLENFKEDTPSELDVGDEVSGGGPPASPLDLLLTGLVSIFIISTALLSIMLFLRFRRQSQHPEFHRLQDLPMDDLLEDAPLSRYTY
ncbi:uncharacterized protein LOC143474891 [Brachyhypopomus gauderio]|uniref:uncharacterized protein LOC143474891 n=1 Tax=Brachyhypopomus gauderio TaxID=698409 RepID=UPI004041C3B1